MSVQKVGIIAECICDLPKKYMKEHNISVVYFLVETHSGVFTDTDEITAGNILDYMAENESVPISCPPPADVYIRLFEEKIREYGEAVFIATGSGASASYGKACEAKEKMGENGKYVHIVDSKHLSTGLGHIVIIASELAEEGKSSEEILSAIDDLSRRVSTSFITVNADYLFRNGRVSERVKKICDTFKIHPVLMMKNGAITLKSLRFGNYEKAGLRYVRSELKKSSGIDKKRIFLTHVGVSSKKLEKIKNEITRLCPAENVIVTKASAAISCNCGPETFGVLFIKDK